jgi:hypothetical protein
MAEGAPVRYRSGVWDSDRWQRFSARAGDIIISTPEKSGTTWMQMICALLIFQRTTFDRSLDLISPWLDMQVREIGDVIAFWEVREQPNVLLVHYADLQRDLEGEMRRIAQRLDIDIDEDRLPDLVPAAGIEWAHHEPVGNLSTGTVRNFA